jgi:hypothetical protein
VPWGVRRKTKFFQQIQEAKFVRSNMPAKALIESFACVIRNQHEKIIDGK